MAETQSQARTLEACRRFLTSFGQTIKLMSLYQANHPVPAAAAAEAWSALHEIFTESRWPDLTVALSGGRWLVNEAVLAESAQAHELLALVFRSHAMQSATFLPEAKLFEFTALCELAATPPNRAYEGDAGDYLKERGVKSIRLNVEEFVRSKRVKTPASALIENPILQAQARRAGPPPAPAQPGKGFGGFIKSLIDDSVADPAERTKVYGEAVRLVEQAISRHVSEATHNLMLEKQGILNERMRAENVMANVADGKVVVDKEGRVLMMDPAAENIVGKSFVDVAGKPILDSVKTGEQMLSLAKDLIIPENGPVSQDVRLAGDEDVLDAFRQSLALVQDERGRLVGTYAVLPYVLKYREAVRLREEFIANITHDLKAPLASICSALELISDRVKPRLSKEEAGFLEISLRNSRTLSQMISEILDFSKIQSGKMTVALTPTPIEPMLRGAVEALTPLARTKSIALELADADLPAVSADHGRVVQILNNLLSNAIKFTPNGGRVTVSAQRGKDEHAGTAVITVEDNGCGISQADRKRIFEKFVQATPAGTRREGVGLGLAIVKELVARHKGTLWVDSEVGKGSAFHFTLPLAATLRTERS